MKAIEAQHQYRALLAAIAGALALGLAACGAKTNDDKVGQNLEPRNTNSTPDKTADSTERKLDQAEDALREKTAETGKAIEDATLTAKVKSALVAEPGLKALAINVDTVAGVVTLRGTADSPVNRDKAAQIASTVDGVRSVRNELVVVPS